VSFSPPSEGEFEGLLVIATNDPSRPEVQVALTGNGLVGGVPGTSDEFPEPEDDFDGATIKTCGCDASPAGGAGWGLGLLLLVYGRRKLPPVIRTQN
jgi:MYXO-CTERM domain-containing protein